MVIPSSLLGAALLIVLFVPGLAYVLRHERAVPAQSYTPFREALRVVFVSAACLTVAAIFAAGLRWLFPRNTPNFHGLVQHPSSFAREHYVQLAWWALALIALATILAVVAADPRIVRIQRRLARTRVCRLLTGSTDASISPVSAWYRVVHLYDGDDPGPIFVGAQLDDGTYIEGQVFSFSPGVDGDENREIVLSAPLRLTTVNGRVVPFGAQFTVISARHIVRLEVNHLKPKANAATAVIATTEQATEGLQMGGVG